ILWICSSLRLCVFAFLSSPLDKPGTQRRQGAGMQKEFYGFALPCASVSWRFYLLHLINQERKGAKALWRKKSIGDLIFLASLRLCVFIFSAW
ncbi:MAG: hypothetical protein JW929_14350, partial [Anaerolineales bacterium]|nr:hypothetical protein [Anaerolineales bacterium]